MIGFKLTGSKQLADAIKKKTSQLDKTVKYELQATVVDINRKQKQLAPKDIGDLAGSLNFTPQAPSLNYEVFSEGKGAMYAPYQEFGTGSQVKIPPGLEKIASQYRGKGGGNFEEMVESIKQWCRRKGIDEKAAYPIAVNILRNGVRPQPFFYQPAFEEWGKFLKRIQKLLSK